MSEPTEEDLMKDGLVLLDDALALIMEIKTQPAQAIANVLHAALVYAEHLTINK